MPHTAKVNMNVIKEIKINNIKSFFKGDLLQLKVIQALKVFAMAENRAEDPSRGCEFLQKKKVPDSLWTDLFGFFQVCFKAVYSSKQCNSDEEC